MSDISKNIKVTIIIDPIYKDLCNDGDDGDLCPFQTFEVGKITCCLFNRIPIRGRKRCESCVETFG